MNEVSKQIESLLFACGRKISVEELQGLVGTDSKQVIVDALQELKQAYQDKDSSLMIFDEGDLWKFTTKEAYLPLVRKINPNTELSKTMMETLAVIAWKQPILQSEVIHIRTNKAYEHISELEKMQFLIKEKYGRTYLLKLSQKFYDYFDLEGEQAARELFKQFKEKGEKQKKVGEFEEGSSSEGEVVNALAEVAKEAKEVAQIVEDKVALENEAVENSNVDTNNKESNEGDSMADEEYVNPKKEDRDVKEALGEEEETVYSSSDRETLVDKDEISPVEDAFMEGYNQAEGKMDADKEKEKPSDDEDAL